MNVNLQGLAELHDAVGYFFCALVAGFHKKILKKWNCKSF